MSGRNTVDTAEQSRGAHSPPKLQPRVVLVLVLGAAFAGVWLTHRGQPLAAKLRPWATAVTTGTLAGGVYWRLVLFDADAFDQTEHRQAVRHRWRRLETALVCTATLSSGAFLIAGTKNATPEFGRHTFTIGTLASVACWAAHRQSTTEETSHLTRPLRAGLLAGTVTAIAGFAWIETATTALDWSVRLGHLTALAFWLGGAVWHNFVVLPVIRARPAAANAVKSQAQAFRRHLPVVIVVLLTTGVYQTVELVGYSLPALKRTTVGHFVVAKLLVLTALSALVVSNVRKRS